MSHEGGTGGAGREKEIERMVNLKQNETVRVVDELFHKQNTCRSSVLEIFPRSHLNHLRVDQYKTIRGDKARCSIGSFIKPSGLSTSRNVDLSNKGQSIKVKQISRAIRFAWYFLLSGVNRKINQNRTGITVSWTMPSAGNKTESGHPETKKKLCVLFKYLVVFNNCCY